MSSNPATTDTTHEFERMTYFDLACVALSRGIPNAEIPAVGTPENRQKLIAAIHSVSTPTERPTSDTAPDPFPLRTFPATEATAAREFDPDVVEGSARQTTANFIKSRRYLQNELAAFSDVAISLAVEVADHRTCFRRDCGYEFCSGCDDVIAWAKEIDERIKGQFISAAAHQARTLDLIDGIGT